MTDRPEDLLRDLAPQVLGAVVRRYGHFDTAEDAVQEALLAAAVQWPRDGTPRDPRAWLITVAARRLTDLLRAEQARRRREDAQLWTPVIAPEPDPGVDDSLVLLFLCCHPALSPASRIALTLRAVGGLTTAEIARAFLVPEATMTRRISRAKRAVAGASFSPPPPAERAERLDAVLHVLYLVFTEGYARTSGPTLHRAELSGEAIRLTRLLHRLLPDDTEVAGLLALMLLTDARRAARTGPAGELVPMAEQDRSRWDVELIREGVALLTETLPRGEPGPYQIQAAIAALHDEAPSAEETDWPQIVALYEALAALSDNPVVALNRAVAVAMARGPAAGLALLPALDADPRLAGDHRLPTVRAHLLELSGDADGARDSYLAAAVRAANLPQQRYLHARAARLTAAPGRPGAAGRAPRG
ncbi:MAG: RNA polymerase sigma factor [Pseudonocardiales bacterium]|nr:RNA polymerase sigma factor [Pseudonocardiales bacterium]